MGRLLTHLTDWKDPTRSLLRTAFRPMMFIFVLLVFFAVAGVLSGCTGVVEFLHGPNQTPQQEVSNIYADSYALGYLARMEFPDEIDKITGEAQALLDSPDPGIYLSRMWMQSLLEQKYAKAAIYFTASNIFQRLGATVEDKVVEITDGEFRWDLFKVAVGAFLDGVAGKKIVDVGILNRIDTTLEEHAGREMADEWNRTNMVAILAAAVMELHRLDN